MGLPSLFSSSAPDSPRKLFLAMLVSDAALQASLWEVVGQEIVILERSSVHYYKESQALVVQADKALQELGKQSENVDEVIFGLDPHWVDKQGIKEDKKPLLKKMTDDLSLKAVGFVVTLEAVAQDLAQTTSVSSHVLIELTQEMLVVSITQQHTLKGTEQVGRSGNVAADVTEALARFKHEQELTLPTTMRLFSLWASESEMGEAEQTLINHDWVEAGLLTQPPVIEVAPANVLLDAITRQGGRAVAQSLGLIKAGGPVTPKVTPAPTSFGIPIPDNAVPVTDMPEVHSESRVLETRLPEIEETNGPVDDEDDHPKTTWWSKLPLSHLLANPARRPYILGGFALGILTVGVMGYLYVTFTATAVAVIQLKTTPISKEVQLILDPTATSPDPLALTLPAQPLNVEVKGSDSVAVTGTKLVGDPAKGTVTLFNKTTSAKTFSKGTELKSGSYLFTLDQEVTIASASVTTNSGSETKTFGKSDATITAKQIGEESNLGGNQEFTIASFDVNTYSAANSQALTGGASREVRVVSAQDQTTLEQNLRTRLLQEAEVMFKQQAGAGEYVATTGRFRVGTRTFSAKLGEEVNQLTLEMSGEAEGLRYLTQDLQPLAQQVLAEQVPAGQELLPESLQMLSSPLPAASNSAQVKLNANLSSQIRPAFTLEALKSEVAGKSLDQATTLLRGKPEVAEVRFTFQPPIAATLLRRVPPASRLEVQIK